MGNKIVQALSSNGIVLTRTKQFTPLPPPPLHLELRYFCSLHNVRGSSFNSGGTTLLEGVEETLFGYFGFLRLCTVLGQRALFFSRKRIIWLLKSV